MIIDMGPRKVVVLTDVESARYDSDRIVRLAYPAQPALSPGRPVRAVVELLRYHGGMTTRALLGGEFVPDTGTQTRYEVHVIDDSPSLGVETTCASSLSKPFVVGLPQEFAQDALTSVAASIGENDLPAGLLRVDRAGYDEVDSSQRAFQLAGNLLRHVLTATLYSADVEADARETMQRWS